MENKQAKIITAYGEIPLGDIPVIALNLPYTVCSKEGMMFDHYPKPDYHKYLSKKIKETIKRELK